MKARPPLWTCPRCRRRIDTISPHNHVHHFRLVSPVEVDADFRAWLREAYAVGAQDHPQRGRRA